MVTSKIPPLRPITLNSRPYNHRALAWSRDAELAVAADDSVTVFVPTFPILDPTQPLDLGAEDPSVKHAPPAAKQANGMGILPSNLPEHYDGDDDLGGDDDDDDDDDEFDEAFHASNARMLSPEGGEDLELERQFREETTRVLSISYPPLHPELNLHVWEAAGKPMPLIRSTAVVQGPRVEDNDEIMVLIRKGVMPQLAADGSLIRSAVAVDEDGDEAMEDAQDEGEDEGEADGEGEGEGEGEDQDEDAPPDGEEQQPENEAKTEDATPPPDENINPHPGAGMALIGRGGTGLNHVVAVEWSPTGLGRNMRPVLAVLTSCGSLAVYGEGGLLPFGSAAKPARVLGYGDLTVRDLQSWLVLWAVGENFVLPGQEEYGYGEFVKAFAWAGEMGVGKALLAYMNDLRELVVLCVGTTFQMAEDGLQEAIWNVQEVARIETRGPHVQLDHLDPDYIPSDTSYGLRWGPWVKGKVEWSCLLSYMDRNYIGFKKININAPTWNPRETPTVTYILQDWNGFCAHLDSDAFLEFEDMIWEVDDRLICRGIIATPLLAEPFEVALNDQSNLISTHHTNKCNTTFPRHTTCTPITGLVIHPIPLDTTAPPLSPLYTAVRLSATATNPDWWESNTGLPTPQWVHDINAKITRLLPLGRAIHEGNPNAESAEDGELGIVPQEEHVVDDPALTAATDADGSDEGASPRPDEEEDDPDYDPHINAGPDVHPYTMRLWGLALSPGGGTSAVLTTPMLTQQPMRGHWHAYRSRVLFGSQELRTTEDDDSDHAVTISNVEALGTEARLWEWLYGGGPGIPGITPPQPGVAERHVTPRLAREDEAAEGVRAQIWDMFVADAAAQRCEICGEDGGELSRIPVEKDGKGEGDDKGEGNGTGEEAKPKQDENDGGRVLDLQCDQGHRVAVCGATGLAILTPGVSRACGACHSRCLDREWLVENVLLPAGRREEADFLESQMVTSVCARCGGKYLD